MCLPFWVGSDLAEGEIAGSANGEVEEKRKVLRSEEDFRGIQIGVILHYFHYGDDGKLIYEAEEGCSEGRENRDGQIEVFYVLVYNGSGNESRHFLNENDGDVEREKVTDVAQNFDFPEFDETEQEANRRDTEFDESLLVSGREQNAEFVHRAGYQRGYLLLY